MMNAQQIRQKYITYFQKRGHKVIAPALLVPQNDPSTLFTGSGMQPIIPYLLGEEHPEGNRLVDSQPCIRVSDIDEIGDNRHTTFFEMLGNWSLGDYFKEEQINWFFEFLTKEIGLNPKRIYVTCYFGNEQFAIPKDVQSGQIWEGIFKKLNIDHAQVELINEQNASELGTQNGRIFYYQEKNWWCRASKIEDMPVNEPGGPDTEVFYLFDQIEHDPKFGKYCHPNCDCGRYIEIGNSVFMEYLRTEDGFKSLPKKNVDFGGGLERIAAAAINSPDIFKISLLGPIIDRLEKLSGKSYQSETTAMRVITDHLRGAFFLCLDGVFPSNKEQGYVLRRLIRRAIRFSFDLGIENNFLSQIGEIIADIFGEYYIQIKDKKEEIIQTLIKEESLFRQTLRKGIKELAKLKTKSLSGADIFKLYDTYGFPVELALEEAFKNNLEIDPNWQTEFQKLIQDQKTRSQTATKGTFKGGLGGHQDIHKKYHTATHLMYKALKEVLGEHVIQHGSNITEERLRFDFSHPQKMTPEEIQKVEDIVNQKIKEDLVVSFDEYPTKKALNELHAMGAFGDRYGDKVKVYKMTPKDSQEPFSLEICGGPHVQHTATLADGGKRFKIIKEESSSAGIRRIKAQLI